MKPELPPTGGRWPGAFGRLLGRAAAGLMIAATLGGCTLLGVPVIDAACQGRPDAVQCQGALEAARPELDQYVAQGYTLEIEQVVCNPDGCATWVTAVPPPGECRAVWSASVVTDAQGPWRVDGVIHGDPPCIFEE